MHILIYSIPSFAFISCCFYGKIKEKLDNYKLDKITDCIVELNNSRVIINSVRGICLVDINSSVFELNGDNSVIPTVPYDNIIIQQEELTFIQS